MHIELYRTIQIAVRNTVGREAIEGLRFLTSLPRAGAGARKRNLSIGSIPVCLLIGLKKCPELNGFSAHKSIHLYHSGATGVLYGKIPYIATLFSIPFYIKYALL